MITFPVLLYLLAGVSLPAVYIFLVSRWIEAESRTANETVLAPGGNTRTIPAKCIPVSHAHAA